MREGALAAAGVGAVAGGWIAARRFDHRRIERDPLAAALSYKLEGRPLEVVSRDGTRLHAEVFGPEDAPTVVLAHGWTCALRFWTLQIQDLSSDMRVVAFDQRGHGRSERGVDHDYSIDRYSEDLQAVLEACVPAGQRCVLAGHSLGGMATVAWAGDYPDEVERRLAGVVLVNTGMSKLVNGSMILRTPPGLDPVTEYVGGLLISARAPLPKGSTPISHRVIHYVALGPDASPAQIAFCERMVLDTPHDVRGGSGGTLSRLDLQESIASLTVPTVVIAGGKDRLTPQPLSERLAEALPGLTGLVVVPRSGHMGPVEFPREVTMHVRELCTRAAEQQAQPAPAASA